MVSRVRKEIADTMGVLEVLEHLEFRVSRARRERGDQLPPHHSQFPAPREIVVSPECPGNRVGPDHLAKMDFPDYRVRKVSQDWLVIVVYRDYPEYRDLLDYEEQMAFRDLMEFQARRAILVMPEIPV
jgi:hypothetical protein